MVGGRHTRSAVGDTRRRDRAQFSRNLGLLLGCVILVGSLISLFTVRGVRILSLRQDLAMALLQTDLAETEQQELNQRWTNRNDPAAIEDAVREQLGWVKPGEIRVIFVDRPRSTPSEGE